MYHESFTVVNSPIVRACRAREHCFTRREILRVPVPLYGLGFNVKQIPTFSFPNGWIRAAKPGLRPRPGAERLPLKLPALLYNRVRLN